AAFASRKNVDLSLAVGPIPEDLRVDGLLPLRDVRARIDGLDLAPARAWLPADLEAGVISADLRIPRLAPGEAADVDGHLAVAGLRFAGGEPVDVRLEADLVADLQKLDAEIDALRLRVG